MTTKIPTTGLTKIPGTRADVRQGDIIDGAKVDQVQHGVLTGRHGYRAVRLQFEGEQWGEWFPANWHISVWR